jgi:hypothetical protein
MYTVQYILFKEMRFGSEFKNRPKSFDIDEQLSILKMEAKDVEKLEGYSSFPGFVDQK